MCRASSEGLILTEAGRNRVWPPKFADRRQWNPRPITLPAAAIGDFRLLEGVGVCLCGRADGGWHVMRNGLGDGDDDGGGGDGGDGEGH